MITGKIDAIKQVRELVNKIAPAIVKTDSGDLILQCKPSLKDCKDLVDAIFQYAEEQYAREHPTTGLGSFNSVDLIDELKARYEKGVFF